MSNVKLKPSEEKIWLKHVTDDYLSDPIPKCTALEYLKKASSERLHHYSINYYGNKVTYADMFRHIDTCANAFYALGVREGDIVSFLTSTIPECIYSLYAINKLGATANTIDPRMDTAAIARMIKGSGSKILVVVDVAFFKIADCIDSLGQDKIVVQSATTSLDLVKTIAIKLKVKTNIKYSDKVIRWKTFISGGKGVNAPTAPYVGDRTVCITYTGGTTGVPKGVMLTNDSVNAVSYNFKYAMPYYEPRDRFLGIIPVFTSYGFVCGLHMPLCLGAEFIPIPKFNPYEFGKLVKKYRPNHMISTPAFYEMLMDSKEVKGLDLSFLTTLGSGGDTMNEGLETRLGEFMKEHNIKYPLAQGYGLSEMSAAASFCVNDKYRRGSVGIPSVTTIISAFDPETGEELDYNQNGEICVTGPSMMKGYFNNPEETANVMRTHSDGTVWIHTGDLGYIDEDGFLFIIGRIKRMITRFDGHKVFPLTIENMVSERNEVRNCCVVGVDDRERSQGQYPMVLVELNDGLDKAAVCKAIYEDCNARCEERGRPVAVVALDSIPLTNMGKNDYRTLEKQYKAYDYVSKPY